MFRILLENRHVGIYMIYHGKAIYQEIGLSPRVDSLTFLEKEGEIDLSIDIASLSEPKALKKAV